MLGCLHTSKTVSLYALPDNTPMTFAKKSSVSSKKAEEHYVVGIGASAGGLEAINELFDFIPHGGNFSFVLVQHLSPTHKSMMDELLAKHTEMKIVLAEEGTRLLPNHVYLIPSKNNMTLKHNKLHLTEKPPTSGANQTIDIFLESLAHDKKDRAIAIILSGTGSDGTKGIEHIKEQGGLVIVQDPATAKFDGMPNSAIASGYTDLILPPEMMAEEIFRHPADTKSMDTGQLILNDAETVHLKEIISLVREQTTHDFSSYKEQTLHRRILRRIAQVEIDSPKEYIHFLRNNPDEVKYLSKEFLIGVTHFFRDPEAFKVLKETVLPEIISKKSADDTIKIWVAACSTGEEAYTMAMLVCEELQKQRKTLDVKIFATDIDSHALELAAKGMYPEAIEKDIAPERLDTFFTREGSMYCVNQKIRRMVIFAHHNVIKDPPFSKLDLVSCRNMLIYMKPVLQRKVLATFHFSLMVGSYLFLGPSESCEELQPALKVINKKWNLFKINSKSRNFIFDGNNHEKGKDPKRSPDLLPKRRSAEHEMQEAFHELITEELGYAAVFINEEFELLQAIGDYKHFLEMPDKVLKMNLLKMVPRELSLALNLALRKATRDNQKVTSRRIELVKNGVIQYVSLTVKPYLVPDQFSRKFITVLLKEESSEVITAEERAVFDHQVSVERLLELENELKQTKHDLQTMVEELETSNEEMQSSNEELLSSNEELQSTNEELQSVNEELHTVNAEHQQKIRQLEELNDDLNNYFRSSDIGQIFLDKNLIIRRFTPAVKHQINLIESDIGRPIEHLSYNIRYENLIEDIRQVIKNPEVIEKEIETRNGRFYQMKIMPYVRHDKTTDGAVVSFIDISAVKELNNLLEGVLNSSTSGIMAFSPVLDEHKKPVDLKWTLINRAGKTILGKANKELEGLRLLQELPGFKKDGLFKKLAGVFSTRKPLHLEQHYTYDGIDTWMEIIAVPLDTGITVTLIDISEKKAAEEELISTYEEVKEAEEKLRKLNMELEKRVEERTRELTQSEERFRLLSRATNDAVWDWDLVAGEFWWNEGFLKIFGFKAEDIEPGVDSWFNRLHPDESKLIVDELNEAINKGENQWAAEHRFLNAAGSYTWVYNRSYILKNEYGIPCRMLGSMIDLSSLKKAQEELELSNKNLRKINTDLDNFVYTASHDLRAPIANLEGLLMLLKPKFEEHMPPNEQRLIQLVEASIEKLKRTILGLLEITKVQKDLERKVEQISFAEVLEDVESDVRKDILESKAIIETDFKVTKIKYNRVNLQSILYNLLSNALKYRSPEQPLHVRISTEHKDGAVALSFTDNGLGMSEQQQKKLFTMFNRFHTHVDGTGIGLYMVKRIIENNEGRIKVESKVGKGTTFKIYFKEKKQGRKEKEAVLQR